MATGDDMGSFHIKSIILGIGIGIVMTSIISIIYLAGAEPQKLNKEEIMRLAEEYGMVKKESIIQKSQTSQDFQIKNPTDENQDSKAVEQKVETQQEVPSVPVVTEPQISSITVLKGDTSEMVAEKLLKAGLINDVKAFCDRIDERGLSGSIDIGEYHFTKDSGMDKIIDVLTGKG